LKIGYLDCQSGISGDMFLAACVDAGANFETIQAGIDSLNTGNCKLQQQEVKKFGFRALKVDVLHDPEHAHRHLHHINQMIDDSSINERTKKLAKEIFLNLAKAEAKVHGSTLEKVHFHEVGAIDSIADIVGGAIAWDLLGLDRLICSPIATGKGKIKIAHGYVSVPAPATVEILKSIPLEKSEIEAELTTPTGAAIVSTLANDFGGLPAMSIQTIGVGAGTRELLEQANVLRLTIGTSTESDADEIRPETIQRLETNLDDVSGEVVGYCTELLMAAGAVDVYTTPIQVKKNRPGIIFSVLCHTENLAEIREILFRETGTLGIRHETIHRFVLQRELHKVTTPWGRIDGKLITQPDGSKTFTPEFESCKKAAIENQVTLQDVFSAATAAFHSS
jgi:pyridinium-3,5-bisthiocarboxylic acid mononucleotide nickel chelatase